MSDYNTTQRCIRCKREKSRAEFLRVMQDGSMRPVQTCAPCRERNNAARQQRIQTRLRNENESVEARPPPSTQEHIERDRQQRLSALPLARRPDIVRATSVHVLSSLTYVCEHCNALHFLEEKTVDSSRSNPRFPHCCLNGKVVLPMPSRPPPLLWRLFSSQEPDAKSFRDKVRMYNNALSFSSAPVIDKEDHFHRGQGGVYSFRIKGQLHHFMGKDLLAAQGDTKKFAQIYIHDPDNFEEELENRIGIFVNSVTRHHEMNRVTLQELQSLIHEVNPYAQVFKNAGQVLRDQPGVTQSLRLRMLDPQGRDPRVYNRPTANEIGVLMIGLGEEEGTIREIILHKRSDRDGGRIGGLQRMNQLHSGYLPLWFVLFYPYGEQGWHANIPLAGNTAVGRADREQYGEDEERREERLAFRERNPTRAVGGATKVTLKMWHAFYLHPRRDYVSLLFYGSNLFQEFCVDVAASIEYLNLDWIRKNQNALRADRYKGLEDAFNGAEDLDAAQVGRKVVLPSSFAGSPRNMAQLYQDAMAIVRCFGKPDLFITMTCNPKWDEIQSNLYPGQSASDRPDLVSRVFSLKLKELMNDLLKRHIFGEVQAHVYTIEYQKRGLPHAHILLILTRAARINTAEDIDTVVSAEIPDPEDDPELYRVVSTAMLHGPCEGEDFMQAPCLHDGRGREGKCSKSYPRQQRETTVVETDGYPQYRRRGLFTVVKKLKKSNGTVEDYTYTDKWVVPYSPFLAKKYNCHINIEVCTSVKAVKYLYKYVYKGPDRATVGLNTTNDDETQMYLDARYLSPPEACWKTLGNVMHDRSPSIMRLAIHLPDEQTVMFNPEETNLAQVLEQAKERDTTLLGFFAANEDNLPGARDLTYAEFPQKFVWNAKLRRWAPRKTGFQIGRIYFCGPKTGERFFLRMLLNEVRGACNFKDLRTFGDTVYSSFREACAARGLLQDDDEWSECLTEASVMQTGKQLRDLFMIILTENEPSNPAELWENHKEALTDDCRHRLIHQYDIVEPTEDQQFSLRLCLIQSYLQSLGKTLRSYNLPEPLQQFDINRRSRRTRDNRLAPFLDYDANEMQQHVEQHVGLLNGNQRHAFDSVMAAVNGQSRLFFLDGPGGTGKTFVENLLLAGVRAAGKVAIAVASSGIAAILLQGGRTAHSTFRIPIPCGSGEICPIEKEQDLGYLLTMTDLIIWDEASMQHKWAFEAVDRTLRDLRDDDRPFGNITVLFSGDFRQCLPVVPKGSRSQIVSSCLKRSDLWDRITPLKLTENLRLLRPNLTADQREKATKYAKYILDVGDGLEGNDTLDDTIRLPDELRLAENTKECLIQTVYPDIWTGEKDIDYFGERAVLSARNNDVDSLNTKMLDLYPGEARTYRSADKVADEESENMYSTEYLNSLVIPNVPFHNCELKIGVPVLLLRNINPAAGLCNGTRLQITTLGDKVLGAVIMTGEHKGNHVLLPRITISTNAEAEFSFVLSRRQFPIRLAFAMTINKAQGQSLNHVGIDLSDDVFSHGQLYVALSRASNPNNVKACLTDNELGNRGFTKNVVFTEVYM